MEMSSRFRPEVEMPNLRINEPTFLPSKFLHDAFYYVTIWFNMSKGVQR